MPYTPYNHTTDPTAFLVLDDRSTISTSGSQVTEWANVSASGLAYNAVASFGTGVTLGTDTNGYKYLEFNGASGLKIPSSSGFDAEFANTGNAGGKTILVVFDLPSNVGGSGDCFLCNKGSSAGVVTTYSGTDNLAWFTYGPLPQLQRNGAAQSWRPCPGGVGSFAITTVTGSTGAGQLDSYRDGQRLYRDGAPSNSQYGTMTPSDGAGYDLSIGSRGDAVYALTGKIRAVVVWNRAPLHHEILATHRYYANRYGFPETLTNQPYSLICDTNSESTIMQGFGGAGGGFNGEIGIFDRVANSLGVGLDANFMLGLASRTTSNMIFDFSTYVAPLIAYLQYLGVPPIVIQWEGINDGFVAAHVTTYAELVIATGAQFVTGTSMAKDGIGGSGASDGTVISAYNIAVLAAGVAGGYSVAGIGEDAILSEIATVDTFNATYMSDGMHVLTPAILLIAPYFVTAVTTALTVGPSLALSGPTTGTAGTPSTNFTVTGTNIVTSTTSTSNDSSAGGTFTPTSLNITSGSPVGTFTYTAATAGTFSIAITNSESDTTTGSPISFVASAEPTCATPTFSPVAGTYTSTQTIAISTGTGGATIKYTIDNSTPTEAHGTAYSTFVSTAATTTIKAIAYKAGFLDSTVATATYTITPTPTPTPTPTLAAIPTSSVQPFLFGRVSATEFWLYPMVSGSYSIALRDGTLVISPDIEPGLIQPDSLVVTLMHRVPYTVTVTSSDVISIAMTSTKALAPPPSNSPTLPSVQPSLSLTAGPVLIGKIDATTFWVRVPMVGSYTLSSKDGALVVTRTLNAISGMYLLPRIYKVTVSGSSLVVTPF